jgi:hypothetical protein
MKILLGFLLAFGFSLEAEAQLRIFRRQSLYSFVGMANRLIFPGEIPYRGYISEDLKTDLGDTLPYLHMRSNTRLPNIESTFSFVNSRSEIKKFFAADMGLCRGYSSLRRKMRFLAFFDPENSLNQPIPDPEVEPKLFKRFYRHFIERIRDYEPVVIPGFSHLHEMSSHPLLEKMMAQQVMYEWGEKNFSKGVRTNLLLRGVFKATTKDELLKMHSRLTQGLSLNLNMMVWLSQKHSSWIHVLEAIDVTPMNRDGSFKITFWNDKAISIDKARSTLDVNADGSLHYQDGFHPRNINATGISAENDGEYRAIGENLKSFCQEFSNFCSLPQ